MGSARSYEGFHAVNALTHVKDLLKGYGGHECAAGFSIIKENFSEFKTRLQSYAAAHFEKHPLKPKLEVDFSLSGEELNLDNFEKLQSFAPFGIGNPSPLFEIKATILETRPVGRDQKHLKFTAKLETKIIDGIAFNFAPHRKELEKARDCSLNSKRMNGRGEKPANSI